MAIYSALNRQWPSWIDSSIWRSVLYTIFAFQSNAYENDHYFEGAVFDRFNLPPQNYHSLTARSQALLEICEALNAWKRTLQLIKQENLAFIDQGKGFLQLKNRWRGPKDQTDSTSTITKIHGILHADGGMLQREIAWHVNRFQKTGLLLKRIEGTMAQLNRLRLPPGTF
jgi:hypothetical protein